MIHTEKQSKEVVLVAPNRDAAITAACIVAERMGGNYMDIVTCELTQDYDRGP